MLSVNSSCANRRPCGSATSRARAAGKCPQLSTRGLEVCTCTELTMMWIAASDSASCASSHAHCSSAVAPDADDLELAFHQAQMAVGVDRR